MAEAIVVVVSACDVESVLSSLEERACALQEEARAIRSRRIRVDECPDDCFHCVVVQRKAADEYEEARGAFMDAYRFEKALEVLR